MAIKFELKHVCKQTGARYGILHTKHGSFETPIFMPVGTKATVKTLENSEIREASDGLILGNTYHLWLEPGDDIVKEHGGIRGFSKWDGALLTDSGGFQVFSLSDIRKISEEGVEFRHHKSGAKLFMSPEDSIRIQNNLGADIIMSFDECPPFDSGYDYMKESVERTIRWAKRGKIAHKNTDNQALFGIVQGGPHKDLRKMCAEELIKMDFPGYSIGGLSVGESKEDMYKVLDELKDIMPKNKPRYLMGVGTPSDILGAVKEGIDMFDCVMPTRSGRTGLAFTWEGKLNLKNAKYQNDKSPLDDKCDIRQLNKYSKSYLNHLIKSNEMMASMIISLHNIHFYQQFMLEIRKSVKNGVFLSFYKKYINLFN